MNANDQAISKMDSAILQYFQPASVVLKQRFGDLYMDSFKITDVFDEYSLNDIFIAEVDFSIWHSSRKFSASNQQAKLTNTVFKAQLLLVIQKDNTKPAYTRIQNSVVKPFAKSNRHNKTANGKDTGSTWSRT